MKLKVFLTRPSLHLKRFISFTVTNPVDLILTLVANNIFQLYWSVIQIHLFHFIHVTLTFFLEDLKATWLYYCIGVIRVLFKFRITIKNLRPTLIRLYMMIICVYLYTYPCANMSVKKIGRALSTIGFTDRYYYIFVICSEITLTDSAESYIRKKGEVEQLSRVGNYECMVSL